MIIIVFRNICEKTMCLAKSLDDLKVNLCFIYCSFFCLCLCFSCFDCFALGTLFVCIFFDSSVAVLFALDFYPGLYDDSYALLAQYLQTSLWIVLPPSYQCSLGKLPMTIQRG